jgi:cytoskeletal protein CcmA (bactofilin family)
MTKTRLIAIFSLAFVLAIPATAKAFSVKTGDSIYIPQGEVIDGNLYAAGASITIDGDVQGDVICGAQTLNINGKVGGDVICGAQSININSEIGGNVRVGAQSVNIKGSVARNVNVAGGVIVLDKDASVGWDMLVAVARRR